MNEKFNSVESVPDINQVELEKVEKLSELITETEETLKNLKLNNKISDLVFIIRNLVDFFNKVNLSGVGREVIISGRKLIIDNLVLLAKEDDYEKLGKSIGHNLSKIVSTESHLGISDTTHVKLAEFIGFYYEVCGSPRAASDYYEMSGLDLYKEKIEAEARGEFNKFIDIKDYVELLKSIHDRFEELVVFLHNDASFTVEGTLEKIDGFLDKAKDVLKDIQSK